MSDLVRLECVRLSQDVKLGQVKKYITLGQNKKCQLRSG